MTLLVLSNNGPWDSECCGVIGIIEDESHLTALIQMNYDYSAQDEENARELEQDDIPELLRERELSYFVDGEPTQGLVIGKYEDVFLIIPMFTVLN